MNLSTLRAELSDAFLAFAWDEWAQLGLLATPRRHSGWAQDPEALIVFTLEIARADPRLFDEVLDWLLANESLLSVRRLRNLCVDDEDRRLVDAALMWMARHRPRTRLHANTRGTPPPLAPLFHSDGPVPTPDEDFARAGLLRPLLVASGKSRRPDVMAPINLAFRLRQILGVGVRAEVVRVLLTIEAPHMTTQALAQSTGYAKRNVHDAIGALVNAGVASTVTVGSIQRHAINKVAWAGFLDVTGFPGHREWAYLLGAVRRLLRWLDPPELEGMSDYLRASQARDLLEELRPTLALADIPAGFSGPPETAWRDLDKVIDSILTEVGVAESGQGSTMTRLLGRA